MKLQLPTRLAASLGVFLAAIITITGELKLSHPIHQLIIAVGVLAGSWLLHPAEGATIPPSQDIVVPPYGLPPITQPAKPPAEQSLP